MKNNKAEKTFLLIITAILMSLTLSFSVNAASGCCAGHGGVKCSAGPDSDGSVICNDGWRDSSCSYSGMEKCRIPTNDSSSSNPSGKNTSSGKNSNSSITRTVSTKNDSLIEKILVVFISICIICPAIPLILFEKLSDLFSENKKAPTRTTVNKYKSEIEKPNVSQGIIICPLCGSTMVKRRGRYGYFYGCSKYPRCTGTRSIR